MLVCATPLVFLWWTLWGPLAPGNDYAGAQLSGALSLRFYTRAGIEPHWYPHLAGGIPAAFLPLAQYYHLPAWLTSLLPGYWSGDALRLFSWRHLALLGLDHAVFLWLARRWLGLGWGGSFLTAMCFTYNLRSLDNLRFGAALEAAVYAHVLLAAAWAYIEDARSSLLAVVGAMAHLEITAGYPVLLPYTLLALLGGSLLVSSVARLSRRQCAGRGLAIVGALVAAALTAAPHIAGAIEYLRFAAPVEPTAVSAGAWSMGRRGPFLNAFSPWAAEVHSAFGGSTLLIVLIVVVFLAGGTAPRRHWPSAALVVLPLWYALGRSSLLFPLVHVIPGFARMRIPGRVLFLLPLLVLLALSAIRRREGASSVVRLTRLAALFVTVGCAVALGITAFAPHWASPGSQPDAYTPSSINGGWTASARLLWVALGLATSVVLWRGWAAPGVLVAATVGQTLLTAWFGTWLTPRVPSPTWSMFMSANHLPSRATAPLRAENEPFIAGFYPGTAPYVAASASRRSPASGLPFYLSADARCVESDEAALDLLAESEDCRPVVVQKHCGPVRSARGDLEERAVAVGLNAPTRLVALTPNGAVLRLQAQEPSWLVTPYPRTPGWTTRIDGFPAEQVSVNGGFLGVAMPAGRHFVAISFRSHLLLWGYWLSAATGILLLAAVGVRFSLRARPMLRTLWLAANAAFVIIAFVGAVRCLREFEARSRKELLLPNNYSFLLGRQLDAWGKEPWRGEGVCPAGARWSSPGAGFGRVSR